MQDKWIKVKGGILKSQIFQKNQDKEEDLQLPNYTIRISHWAFVLKLFRPIL
jgi:hypothetical protein